MLTCCKQLSSRGEAAALSHCRDRVLILLADGLSGPSSCELSTRVLSSRGLGRLHPSGPGGLVASGRRGNELSYYLPKRGSGNRGVGLGGGWLRRLMDGRNQDPPSTFTQLMGTSAHTPCTGLG